MRIKILLILAAATALGGCVSPPQTPVSLSTEILTNPESRVGIAMDTLPPANLQLPGVSCLLCLAVASGANSELSAHAKTLSMDEIIQLKADVVSTLKNQDRETLVVDKPLLIDKLPKTKRLGAGYSKRDFSSYAEQYQLGHMIVIDINRVGMTRPYASYILTGAAQAAVAGCVAMVDLKTNKYNWYLPIDLYLSVDGEWDESKDFPGLTNAYYQVLESLRDMVLSPLNTSPLKVAEVVSPTAK
ncbi:MAG: hypothetical protein P8P26_00120 [Porticoccaceae bacterium]|nr:hypothetical protein [Porticoccaceae bacterium]